jgi:LysM repeat protein
MALTVQAHCDKGGSAPVSPPASGVYDRGPINHATGIYRTLYYYIAWGDAISSIGQRFGVPWQDIAAANGIQGTRIYAGQTLLIPTDGGTGTLPPSQTPPERVYFAPGAISDTHQGTIALGVPKSYILGINAGQTFEINTQSHGEPLFVTVANAKGELLPLNGENGKIENNLWVQIPAKGDYFVTVAPVTLPESPSLMFDITFVIQ